MSRKHSCLRDIFTKPIKTNLMKNIHFSITKGMKYHLITLQMYKRLNDEKAEFRPTPYFVAMNSN